MVSVNLHSRPDDAEPNVRVSTCGSGSYARVAIDADVSFYTPGFDGKSVAYMRALAAELLRGASEIEAILTAEQVTQ